MIFLSVHFLDQKANFREVAKTWENTILVEDS